MKILMLTSYFAPDTAIAAVRPFMFAKYLSQKGHSVTVLRSGEILSSIDESYNCKEYGIEVISYLGKDSFLERYYRGEVTKDDFVRPKSRISFLPIKYRKIVSVCYHKMFKFFDYKKEEKQSEAYLKYMKKAIDDLKSNGKKFDVIFSTYGRLENCFAGEYAKQVFGCSYILDLHDRIAHDLDYLILKKQRRTEQQCLSAPDCNIAVTESYYNDIKRLIPDKMARCIYYGYDENVEPQDEYIPVKGILSFCYTGSMYLGKLKVGELFRALSILASQNKLSLDKVNFHYAGGEFEYIYSQAQKYGVESIMRNEGYLNRFQVKKLQAESDIFVVAARNRKVQDEIPGKFYEGIRACKPILLIVTCDKQYGEMWKLEERYHYGYCYETAGDSYSMPQLCEYLYEVYNRKCNGLDLKFTPNTSLYNDFKFSVLTDDLEKLMVELVENKHK